MSFQRVSRELLMLFSFAILFLHGSSLSMTLDEFLSYYGAIAAAQLSFYFCLFRAFHVQVATIAPQTSRGLLAVGPDMAKILEAVILHKANLSSV
jgi:hypothetical protein